jgi:hypothetical protein
MKKILPLLAIAGLFATQVFAQKPAEDKSKRPSPPATVTQTIKSGATITINYGQPSIKGRTIGKDIEPKDGEVWRTGANEATTFQTDKDIMVNGAPLPAGKYSLFTLFNGKNVTVIFNKVAAQWGAFKYKMEDDALRIDTKSHNNKVFAEKLTFLISPKGEISILWGGQKVSFKVK